MTYTAYGILFLAALALGYVTHRRTIERDDALAAVDHVNAHWQAIHDEEIGRWRDEYRDVFAKWERSQEDELDALAQVNRLRDDLAIEQGRRAAAELELDLHFPMPTVRGERAKVAIRTNVVPLRPKAGA